MFQFIGYLSCVKSVCDVFKVFYKDIYLDQYLSVDDVYFLLWELLMDFDFLEMFLNFGEVDYEVVELIICI